MPPTRNVDELIALAYRDDLTGLHNRRYFSEILTKPLDETPGQGSYSFLLVDIDFFKEINDSYGHRAGDHVLTVVARILNDSIEGEEAAVRYAGDEFILFLPNADQNAGIEKAKNIVSKVQRKALPLDNRDEYVQLTLSIGVASFPVNGNTWQEVIEKADHSLYAAKQQGRNRACVPSQEDEGIIRGNDLSKLFPCPKYIGQQDAFALAHASIEKWRGAQTHAFSCFLLCTGDRGSGKTRFLQEIGKALGDSDSCVVHMSGTEQLRELPYGALIKGLIEYFGTPETLRERVTPQAASLDRSLLEGLLFGNPSAQETLSAETAGSFLVQSLAAIEKENPLALLIDDADLLDTQTVALLQSIYRSGDATPRPFVLMAASENHIACGSEESTSKEDQDRPSSVVFLDMSLPVVELKPLRGEDVEEMVGAVFPTLRVEPLFHTELLLQTRGNPAHAEECLKYLVQRGKLVYHRSAWRWEGDGLEDLPDTLESLLESRLSCLDPEVRSLLERASMMGPDIDPKLIQKLQQSNEGYLWDLLDKALRFGVLRSRSPWAAGELRFSSRTAQKVSYEQIPEEDRISWHLQMARLFESLRQKPNLLQLGPLLYHAQMAGLQAELKTIRERFNLLTPGNEATVLSVPFRKKKRSGPIEHSPIPQEGWPKILSLFHLLRAAIQNLRLYPETSRTVSLACQRLLEGLDAACQLAGSVHLSEADGVVLVNGEPPPWKGEERVATEGFYRFLADASLKDISFHKGLTLEGLKAFLDTWNSILSSSVEPKAAWDAFEERPEAEQIRVNAKIYVAVSESTLRVDAPVLLTSQPSQGPVEDLSRFLGSLESTILSIQENAGEQRIDPKEVAGAVSLLAQAQELLPALQEHLAAAAAAPVKPAEPPSKEETRDGDAAAAESDKPDFDPLSEDDVRCFLADILSGEPQREARGYQRISQAGAQAAEPLYIFLSHTDDAHAGHICARFLKSLLTDFPRRIQEDVEGRTEPAVKVRLLQYAAPVLDDGQRQSVLLAGLQQEEEPIVREALHQIQTQFPAEAARLLLEILPACPDAARYEICVCLGKLGDSRCLPQLLGYLDRVTSRRDIGADRFAEGLCHALGHFQDPQVVQKLGLLLSSNGRLPWQKKRVQPGLRKAALMALERIGGNPVYALLKRHENDKDPWIRFRVKNFLKGNLLPHRPSATGTRPAPHAGT